jgi:hypothetical protein
VSNLTKSYYSSNNISVATNNPLAVSFTTDNATYTLTSVTLSMAGNNTSSPLTVSIYSDAASLPDSSLETLSGANPTSFGNYTFTSAGLTLSPNTTYFATAATAGAGDYRWDSTSDPSETGSATWAIGNSSRAYSSSTWNTLSEVLYISVTATAIPEPGTYAVFAGLVALGLAVWRRKSASAA